MIKSHQTGKITNETKIIKKNQMEILDLKVTKIGSKGITRRVQKIDLNAHKKE